MLILAATPIGNLGDASRRLVEALSSATVIAAEDTRTTQRLLAALGIANRPRLIALHDHNEKQKAAEIVAIAAETDVLLLSDAGMPVVSDPGYGVVAEAAARGVVVTVLPGPSAVLAALAVAGLPTDRFTFEGFAPRKPGERASVFTALADERRTMVFFEAPSRVHATLEAMGAAFGPERRGAVCRELTKLHEETARGSLADLVAWAENGVRGECVIVIEGAVARLVPLERAVADVLERARAGTRMKDACTEVASATGHSSRDLYQAALAAR